MKLKMLSLVAGMILLFSCSNYKKISTSSYPGYTEVPSTIKTSFTTLYPTATNIVWTSYDQVAVPIDWELAGWPVLDKSDFVVRFDMDNEKYYAWYDSNGEWIGTAYVINDVTTLPEAVRNTLNSQYAGYSAISVQKEFWKDKTAFEIHMKNAADNKVKLLVAADGTIIKSKMK